MEKTRLSNWFWLAVEVVPILAPAAVATFGAVAIFFLILGYFNPPFIWTLGLIAAVAACCFIVRHYPRDVLAGRGRKAVNILVILGVVAWGAVNIGYTSSHVLVNRDPALYANAGIWLTKHDNLKIPASHTFGNVPGVQVDAGTGFKAVAGGEQDVLYAQGLHLLPAFIGLLGRVVGVAHALHINVIFGMTALFGIYAFGRALVKRSWWAAVVAGAVAVSMPMINFSRDTYSEPLAATFTFGGLALFWLALRSEKLSLWFLTGLVMGAGTMTRIDGYLTIAEILAFLVVMLLIAFKGERSRSAKQATVLVFGMAITTLLGWLDVSRMSVPYYQDLHTQVYEEFLIILALLVLGPILVYFAWRGHWLNKLDRVTASWWLPTLIVAVCLGVVIMMSRPLWYGLVTNGVPTYAQLTTQWVSWYIGGVLAALGVIGILLAIASAVKERSLMLIASLIVIIGTSMLYLVKPNIYPDHIWASRRLLPVILPGVAVFGALTLDWLSDQFLHKIKWKYAVAGLASVAIVLTPLVTSKPQLLLRSFEELGAVKSLCSSIPKNAAILWVENQESQEIVMPTRSVCGVPSQGFKLLDGLSLNRATLAQLATNARSHGNVPVIGIYSQDTHFLPATVSKSMRPVAALNVRQLEHTLTYVPQRSTSATYTLDLAIIQSDGSVAPL